MLSRRSVLSSFLLALGLASLAGCADAASEGPLPVRSARSTLARDTAPSLTDQERTSFADDRADFGVDFFREVVRDAPEENALVSPHSASIALAMTYAGASGETKDAMAKALRFRLAEERTHAAFNATDLALTARQHDRSSGAVRLAGANSLWAKSREGWSAAYLDALAKNYGSGIQLLDFTDGVAAARTINGWVSDRTETRIPELLAPAQVQDASWVLVNALYFKANWQKRFEPSATLDAAFHTSGGATVRVPTMHHVVSLRAVHTDRFDAVELPYDGGQLAMVALLPKEGTFTSFVSAFSGHELLRLPLEEQLVQLAMPKFGRPATGGDVTPALERLGMPRTGSFANAGEIEVIQKTFLEVDEAGTEAAAATAVVGRSSAAPVEDPPKPLVISLDRPFLYAILDKPTGALLFVGQLTDPSKR